MTIAPGETHTIEVVFDPSGVGFNSDTFYVESNDPDRNGGAYLRVQGSGSLFDSALLGAPASVSLGSARLDGTSESTFNALNLGGEPLVVTTTVEGDGFFLAQDVPLVFQPGSTNKIRIRFHPTTVGPASGSVIFHTGDPSQPLKTVRLSGQGEGAPQLELSPLALSLGVGDGSGTARIMAANSGTEDLFITVAAADAPFSLIGPMSGAITVPAGASTIFSIGLDDPPAGTLSGHLSIHSNDPSVPLARIPLRAHVDETPVELASFVAAASGPGLGDTRWSSRGFLLNPTTEALQSDLVFRPGDVRGSDGPDAGVEVPARSQRVIPNLVRATGRSGIGGINLRASEAGLVAVSRTFATGADGTYGQFVAAQPHDAAIDGQAQALLAGLSGNGDFHTNIGVLNLGSETLSVDYRFFDSTGGLIGNRRVNAQPGAFAQVVSVISKLTEEIIIGGYATFVAVDENARYLAYASVVDDRSHDPSLILPQELDPAVEALDLVIPAAAALPGAGGTSWRSQLDVVNTSDESRSITVDYTRSDGNSIASMPMALPPGESLHFDDVVGGLFGESGKGSMRVSASGPGIFAASRTFNDSDQGTFGQSIPALRIDTATRSSETVLLPGLSSEPGFRTNLGFTSVASVPTSLKVMVYSSAGSILGEIDVDLPAQGFVQVERALANVIGFTGTAWAEVTGNDPNAAFFAHASVVDETTGDPTYIPALPFPNLS